jgi:hypothetical protein
LITRRELVNGVAATVLIGHEAKGQVRQSGARSAESGFNGNKIQTNPSFPFNGTDWPFLNILKVASAWSYSDNHFPVDYSTLDANGYPIADPIAHGGLKMEVTIPTQSARPGRYVCKWDDGGRATRVLLYSHGSAGGTRPTTGTGVKGRFAFLPGPNEPYLTVEIQVTGNPYLKNLRVCHEADEAALDAGQVFGVRFKQLISDVGAIRFLDWQYSNITNISKWEHRKPISYYNYNANYFPADIMTRGLTTSSGDNYSISKPGFTLVDKAQVIVRFDHDSTTAAPTLNVNGTGAKVLTIPWGDASYPIWGQNTGRASSGPGADAPYSLCTYDQSLDVWLCDSETFGLYGVTNGVPPELCFRLCDEVGAHPWFCAPYLAVDCGSGQLPTTTDYMSQLAKYCRDHQPSWMTPFYETPNETWNSAAGFYATRYAWNKQRKRSGVQWDDSQWVGTVGSLIGQAVSAVYGNDRTKYRMVIGYSAYLHYPPEKGNNAHRLESSYYVSQGGSPAKNWVTHITYANYFNSWYYQTSKMLTLAHQHFNARDQAAKDAIVDEYVSGCSLWDGISGGGGFSLRQALALVDGFASFARANGMKVAHYEGGYSPDFQVDAWTQITGITRGSTTVIALSRSPGNLTKQKSEFNSTLPGMKVRIDGVGGTTGLNNNTYTVISATSFSVTIDVNSSGMGAYTSGGRMSYTKVSETVNPMHHASKFRPLVKAYTLEMYRMLASTGIDEFPSEYSFAGANSPFTIWDPHIYLSPTPPRWLAIQAWNSQ